MLKIDQATENSLLFMMQHYINEVELVMFCINFICSFVTQARFLINKHT